MFGFRRLLGSRRPDECLNTSMNWPIVPALRAALLCAPPHLAQLSPPTPTSTTIRYSTGRYQLKGRQSRWVMNGPENSAMTIPAYCFSSPTTMGVGCPHPPFPAAMTASNLKRVSRSTSSDIAIRLELVRRCGSMNHHNVHSCLGDLGIARPSYNPSLTLHPHHLWLVRQL